jgi:hypothetical protein
MRHRLALVSTIATLAMLATGFAFAAAIDDDDYPGSEVIADGKGQVAVKVVHYANETCWKIAGIREGVPHDRAVDLSTERHLYVTMTLARTGEPCQVTAEPLQARLTIPDKPGRISLDIFVLDDKGFLTRSQRHRIQRN